MTRILLFQSLYIVWWVYLLGVAVWLFVDLTKGKRTSKAPFWPYVVFKVLFRL